VKRLRALGLLGLWILATALLVAGAARVIDRRSSDRGAITVGSKRFGESVVLAEIAAQALESEGIRVRRELFLGGTSIAFRALTSGAIDLYPEYTGTGLTAILKQPPLADAAEALAAVRRGFARYDVVWLDPLGFSDAYALAMPRRRAEQLGIRRIGDLVGRGDLAAGFASEFFARDDGWPGLKKRYGLSFGRGPVGMEAGLMYKAAAAGQIDVISAYSTDARLARLDFVVLEDDRRFFPAYEAVMVARRDALERLPAARAVLDTLRGLVSEDDIRRMNGEIDDGRASADVARAFLAAHPRARAASAPGPR
jgi:glycine betaine/choline ABC-type transport system substrate-binding protein